MSPARRVLVIWNPSAGGGDPEASAEERSRISAALAERGVDAEIYESPSEASATARIGRGLEDGFSAIVAAGGDGTVRSVALPLLDAAVPLGILPVGTAMNTAHDLGVPLDLREAAAVIASGEVRSMDVGEVRDHVFLGVVSVGLGAEMLGGAARASKGRFGAIGELVGRAWHFRRTRVCVQLDGRDVRTRAVSIAVANGAFIGHRLELAPGARLDDGRFDVLIFEGFGGPALILHLIRAMFRGASDPRIRRYRATTVGISSHRPMRVRADSDDLGFTPAEIVCRPGALRVLTPSKRGS